ncbi:unnamed protein product [Brassicogethes aeneus]|uniref:EF-hand domain-containing protein n=1 Tax=Brassicogethes aeneus TaxID=1431903 RepID=A0A9P0BFD2_BRAAE|nr:unnamed protein product [Brassicogethes aeneus]
MSKEKSNSPRLSMRGGAMVMKGITIFLASARNNQLANAAQANSKQKSRKKKMNEKDNIFKYEIEALYKIYRKLVTINKLKEKKSNPSANPSSIIGKPSSINEGIDRKVFREILHNTFDIVSKNRLMDRIFCVWDRQNYGLINLENWLFGLSLYLKGSKSKQIEFCFLVYDLNADGFISKEEMFQLLKNCLIKQPQEEDPDESVKDLVDIVMRKFDKDKDGKVSLEDFQETIAEEPLLIEAFGKCLPSETSKNTFLTTLKIN